MGEDRVFVVGSINRDLLIRTPVYPKLGETVLGESVDYQAGGKGANQAVAAARLGASVCFVGCVGLDEFGATMVANLASNNVDVTGIDTVNGAAIGLAVVTQTHSGQNAIIVIAGANAELGTAEVAAGLADLKARDIVVAQLEVPVVAITAALTIATQRGAVTVLNAAPAAPVTELLRLVDILVVNEFEAATLAQPDVEIAHDYAAIAALLRTRHSVDTIVTLGSDGAWLAIKEGTRKIDPYPVSSIDSTGAGDAFVGALAALLAQGYELEQAADWASAAGAHACLKAGAQAGSPTKEDLARVFGIDLGGRQHNRDLLSDDQ